MAVRDVSRERDVPKIIAIRSVARNPSCQCARAGRVTWRWDHVPRVPCFSDCSRELQNLAWLSFTLCFRAKAKRVDSTLLTALRQRT
eukprot:5821935-Prymnesium_polylepis.1